MCCVFVCLYVVLCCIVLHVPPSPDFVFDNFASITPTTLIDKLPIKHPFLLTHKLVVKPDQLIKRRGKSGLIKLNADWNEVVEWVTQRRDKEVKVDWRC